MPLLPQFVVIRELRATRELRERRTIRETRELREHQTVRMLSVGAPSK